jgi:hypothetical protein
VAKKRSFAQAISILSIYLLRLPPGEYGNVRKYTGIVQAYRRIDPPIASAGLGGLVRLAFLHLLRALAIMMSQISFAEIINIHVPYLQTLMITFFCRSPESDANNLKCD